MPASDLYRCQRCGKREEFVFEGTPPQTHRARCSGECAGFSDGQMISGEWVRMWSAPHTGRGSSGEPPR